MAMKVINNSEKKIKNNEIDRLRAELKAFKQDNFLLNEKSKAGWKKYYELKNEVDENYIREQNRLLKGINNDNKKFIELRDKMLETIYEISDDIKEIHYKNLLDALMKLNDVL